MGRFVVWYRAGQYPMRFIVEADSKADAQRKFYAEMPDCKVICIDEVKSAKELSLCAGVPV